MQKIRHDVFPIIFISTVITGLMYLFAPSLFLLLAPGTALLMTLFYRLLHFLEGLGSFGGLTYVLIEGGTLVVSLFLLINGAGVEMDFIAWFFGTQTKATMVGGYILAVYFNAVVLLGGASYYFTQIQYRPSFLFLLCLVPSAIASRNGSDYPIAFGAVIISAFLLICVQYRPRIDNKKSETIDENEDLMNKIIFISNHKTTIDGGVSITKTTPTARKPKNEDEESTEDSWCGRPPFGLRSTLLVGAMCVVLPVLLSFVEFDERAPYKTLFDNAVLNSSFGVSGVANGLSNFTQQSSPGGKPAAMEELLFTVVADKPFYMRRQVFDLYSDDTASWRTIVDEEYNTGYMRWRNEKLKSRYSDFIAGLKWGAETYGDSFADCFGEEFMQLVQKSRITETESHSAVISVKGHETAIVMSAENMYEVFRAGNEDPVYRTRKDEYFTETEMSDDEVYTIQYFGNELDRAVTGLISSENFKSSMNDFLYGDASDDSSVYRKYLAHAYNELKDAQSYHEYVKNQSLWLDPIYREEDIRALAASITEGAQSDLEKAERIEEYFHTNSFTYNPDRIASGVNVGAFIFEKKDGVCTDFATAMVVLARAVGLTARYTEGFVVSELGSDGLYYVRMKHAHAFPEVFIPGYGWRIFEPTVSMTSSGDNEADNGEIPYYVTAIICVALAGILFLIIFAFRERIEEAVFRVRLAFTPNERKLEVLFRRSQRLAQRLINDNGGSHCDSASITAGMVNDTVTKYLGVDLSPLCNGVNDVFYGQTEQALAFSDMYEAYKAAVRVWSKRGK